MSLPDPLPIKPFTRPAQGEVTLPGSKSLTNRALLLAALCDKPVTLTGALFSEDTEIMAEALRRLGFVVKEDEKQKTIYIEGRGGKIPNEQAEIFVGNAGTAARFLTALCAAAPRGTYKLDGVPQMRKRPMKGLIEALRAQGTKITCTGEEGFFPFTIEAHGLKGGEVEIDASESSQMLSALIMIAPLARFDLDFLLAREIRWPFVKMTHNLTLEFGQPLPPLSSDSKPLTIPPKRFRLPCGHRYTFTKKDYAIEPDATSASYFLTLPLVAREWGHLDFPNLNVGEDRLQLQGDSKFVTVLKNIGLSLTYLGLRPGMQAKLELHVSPRGITQDFSEFSDTFLTLAAVAPLLEGPTKITGIAHTRKQETDRVAGAARELKKLIGDDNVIEEEDSLTITPNLDELKKRAARGSIEIETYNDHRFAMSFAILGCYDLLKNGKPWLTIKNPACCAKTFPNFFDVLEQVWKTSHSSP